MFNIIENFLNDYNFLNPQKTLIIGFSGGWDSMCLLHILKKLALKYDYRLVAAHYNHNWRGKESLHEAQNCKLFCDENNIEFYSEIAPENCKKTETVARELRYDFFNRCIEKFNADALFTAHNKTDNAETIVYRAIKGTGITGLEGIKPVRGKIYRPMLEISREEIENYCNENNLKPNCDSSNNNDKYKRNLIRNQIFKFFKEINPYAENALSTLSQIATEENKIVEEYLNSIKKDIFDGEKIITAEFCKLSNEVKKKLLHNLFIEKKIDYTNEKIVNALNFISENANSACGKKTSITTNCWLFVNKKYIETIGTSDKITDTVKITEIGTYQLGDYIFEITETNELPEKFPTDEDSSVFVNLSYPLDYELRTRREGDTIHPLGLSGKKKFKKYLIDKKIPQYLRDELILFCKDSEIMWACGIGLNEKIKVVNKPNYVLTLKKRILAD